MLGLIESLAAYDAILNEDGADPPHTTVPGYEVVSTDSLKDSARRNPALSLRTILNGRTTARSRSTRR